MVGNVRGNFEYALGTINETLRVLSAFIYCFAYGYFLWSSH